MTLAASAKHLIDRYETILHSQAGISDEASNMAASPNPRTSDGLTRPPLRKSFQNIVTAVRKRARAISWRLEGPPRPSGIPRQARRQQSEPCPPTPPPKHTGYSGRLLYLSPGSSDWTTVLSWRPYMATLRLGSIALEPSWTSGMATSRLLSLAHCVDVQACPFHQEELDPMFGVTVRLEDIRAFELIFEGKPSHKFASLTSQDRAVWIDMIWESILALHHQTKCSSLFFQHQDRRDLPCSQPHQTQQRSLSSPDESRPISKASAVDIGRLLLPPLVVANGCPSLTSSACTSSTNQSRPRSPSIANLGELAVVKQRLSQLASGSVTSRRACTPVTMQTRSELVRDSHNSLFDSYEVLCNVPNGTRTYLPSSRLELTTDMKACSELTGLPAAHACEYPETVKTRDICVASPLERLPSPGPPTNSPQVNSTTLLEDLLRHYSSQTSDDPTPFGAIISSLKELFSRFETCQHEQSAKLDDILACSKLQELSLNNPTAGLTDITPIFDKLDELFSAHRHIPNAKDATTPGIDRVAALLQANLSDRAALYQQQADIVRYLNELNTWFETFVSNGTSQIQGLAANVERLSQAVGCDTDGTRSCSTTLHQDVQQLLAEARAQVHTMTTLHNHILSLTQEQRQNDSVHSSVLIGDIVAQQRRENENFLSALVQEISREVRGERLRFVEAMKEATEINVQMHVDQFKQELNKEVVSMTKEVQRLHHEKKAMERQIAELFSFYSSRAPIPRDGCDR